MTPEEFNKIKKEINELLIITESNVSDKLLAYPKIFTRYLDKFIKQAKHLSDLQTDLDKVRSERFKFFKEDYDHSLKNTEIEVYVNGDEKYIDLKRKYDEQKMYTDFLEEFLGMLKNLSFTLREYCQFTMFQQGK